MNEKTPNLSPPRALGIHGLVRTLRERLGAAGVSFGHARLETCGKRATKGKSQQ